MRTTISRPRHSLEFLIELRALFPASSLTFRRDQVYFILLADLRNLILRHEFSVVEFCTGCVWNIFSSVKFLPR